MPYDRYLAFIANAEFYGMPVAFLRAVGKDYAILSTTSIAHVTPMLNAMYLNPATYASLIRLDADEPPGVNGLQQAYHESAHAYMDLKEDESKFKTFIADGIKYYKEAPLTGGSKSKDPDRLFKEAVGCYVGERAAAWWRTLNTLSYFDSFPLPTDPAIRDGYKRITLKQMGSYNTAMAERVYGYEDKSRFDSEQIYTTKPVSDAMKKFYGS